MSEVVFHPEAGIEQLELTDYFLPADPELAAAFAGRLQSYLRAITINPLLFHPRRYQVRRANLVQRFEEYYIAYFTVRRTHRHPRRRPCEAAALLLPQSA